ncbi:MAG: hypothetical protein HN576_09055 [Bacteriovoracaceae bacterium]|jgi:hypothetical protein|nr:hypothetical protein [Bacteriovoracaceae bacterium]
MKFLIVNLILILVLISCTKKNEDIPVLALPDQTVQTRADDIPNVGDAPDTTIGDDTPTAIIDSAEYKASLVTINKAEIALFQAGHKLPQVITGDVVNWLDHEIEIEVGLNSYKKRKWEPGYVVSFYRDYIEEFNMWKDPVFKFIDENSWPAISKLMNTYMDSVEYHYTSFEDDIPEKERLLLENKYNLVQDTFTSYRGHLLDQVERSKIKDMTWEKILEKFKLKDIMLCDKSLDLIYISELLIADDQDTLGPLVENKKIRSLKKESRDLFESSKEFKVYENFLIFIK